MSVLELGSGAGQDCFVLSKLVGEFGSVTGVDMTDEQVRDNCHTVKCVLKGHAIEHENQETFYFTTYI